MTGAGAAKYLAGMRASLLLAAVLGSACVRAPGPGAASPGAAGAAASAAVADTVRIDGSTGVMPLVAAVAREYRAAHPSAAVVMGAGLGASARVQALADGTIDIALASHGVDAADLARRGLVAHEIAKVAVVFAVNQSVPVAGLTEQQVCDLYGGRIASWRELGGPDLAVAPRTRPAGEVDADVVLAGVGCLKGTAPAPAVATLEKPEQMAAALAGTPGAIGMTSLPFVEQSGGRIRAVTLGGVRPTPESVRSGAWRLTRHSYLLTRARPSAAVARFLAFVRSPAGARAIAASGAVPVE